MHSTHSWTRHEPWKTTDLSLPFNALQLSGEITGRKMNYLSVLLSRMLGPLASMHCLNAEAACTWNAWSIAYCVLENFLRTRHGQTEVRCVHVAGHSWGDDWTVESVWIAYEGENTGDTPLQLRPGHPPLLFISNLYYRHILNVEGAKHRCFPQNTGGNSVYGHK